MIDAKVWVRLDATIPTGVENAKADDLINWVKKIQLNAWKQGMSDALDLIDNGSESLTCRNACEIINNAAIKRTSI